MLKSMRLFVTPLGTRECPSWSTLSVDEPFFVAAPSEGQNPVVTVYDALTGVERFEFLAYDPSFLGGVRVAVGDVNADATPDIVTAPGPGGGPHVRAFSGRDGSEIFSFS